MSQPISYLYRCFDREGRLLYAGVTDNVERRKVQHAQDKSWWRDVDQVTLLAFQHRIEALWAEWAVIITCTPLYNRSNCAPPSVHRSPCRKLRQDGRTAKQIEDAVLAMRSARPRLSQRKIADALLVPETSVRRIFGSVPNAQARESSGG